MFKNPLILVDGSSYLYRAYHTHLPFKNSNGESTGVIYCVLNMLRSLLLKYYPTHAGIIFDTKGKTFRNKLFKCYKSNRLPMPDDLLLQIKPLYSIIRAMGLPLITALNVEADDIIGTLAREAEKIGHSVLISTNDKDMAQLVTSKITIVNTMTNTIINPKEVVNKYGVSPELIIDYLALIGDYSDNIPGVPGIGKKTAQVLLNEIGGLHKLYTKLEKVANVTFRGAKRIAERLEKNKEIAYLSYQLATIKTDIKLNFKYENLKVQKPIIKDLILLFNQYNFKKWVIDLKNGNWLLVKNYKEEKNKNYDY